MLLGIVALLHLLLGAGRRPSQGSASVFCYYYLCFLCSEFPARLQSLNPVTMPGNIQRGRKAGRRYKVTAEITSVTQRRMIKMACDLTTVQCTKDARS